MANTNIGISNFVYSQSPFFVRNDHPNFVRFIESYYEYLEQEGKTIERAKGFREALDVDKSIDLYTEKLYSQFLSMIPEDAIADKNLIIKHIQDFYRARGTEKSIEFLMSILYDEPVKFYYPKQDILRASDGKWYQEKSLKIFDIQVNNTADPGIFTAKNFTGRQIRGETSNATATVESVDVYYETGVIVKELKISNQVRDFTAGEIIRAKFEEEGLIKDISANVYSGIIVRADIVNRGNNYTVGTVIDKANVESNTGTGAILIISDVSKAAIKSISPIDGGAGFQNSNIILISSPGGGFGANANVSLVNTDETVHPNSYNIAMTLISAEAGSVIGNTTPYETFAFANMDYILVTTPGNTSNLTANSDPGISIGTLTFSDIIVNSNVFMKTGDSINAYNSQTATSYTLRITSSSPSSNQISFLPLMPGSVGLNRIEIIPDPHHAYSNLTISCGTGGAVQVINLSAWKANSNVFFETYDNIYCFGTNVTITSSNVVSNVITVTPGLPGPLTNEPFQIYKRPSLRTTMANSLSFFNYKDTGPIQRVLVLAGGSGYTGDVILTAQANTRIASLGIIGKLSIVRPGYGYVVGDEIQIINQPYATFGAGVGGLGYVSSVNAMGSITGVRLKQVPGYYVGGTGYHMDQLPTTNVITSTGVGGNVAVTATLGNGERLGSTSDDIGAILKIDIISGGSGYATPPYINLKAFGSGTAQVDTTIIQGVYTYPGRYLNDDGHLSSYNFLQDGKYYHNYSYVTKIKKSIEKYRDALKKLVHPAGTSLFGEYLTIDEGETMNIQAATANQTAKYLYFENIPYQVANLGATTNIVSQIQLSMRTNNLNVNSSVYIEFASGNAKNLNANSTYYVKSIVNANSFIVYSGTKLTASMNVTSNTGELRPYDMAFRKDGKILYVVGDTHNRIFMYDLVHPWDISSAVYRTSSIPILDSTPAAFYIHPNGNTFYTYGQSERTVQQYSINIGNTWNVNSAVLSASLNVSAYETTAQGMTFGKNGDYLYIVGSANDRIDMFTLSSPWNVNSAVYTTNVSVASQETFPRGIHFKPDGTQMYIVGTDTDRLVQYTLGTAWNVATATYNTRTSAISAFEDLALGITLSEDGSLVYISGFSNKRIIQIPLAETWNIATMRLDTFNTVAANTGLATVSLQVI